MEEIVGNILNEPQFNEKHRPGVKQCEANSKQCAVCKGNQNQTENNQFLCTCDEFTSKRCEQTVTPEKLAQGTYVCRYHGTGSLAKPGGRPLTTGRFATKIAKMATDFQLAYQTSLEDPDLLSLRRDIAIIDAFSDDLMNLMAENGITGSEAWSEMRDGIRILENGGDTEVALEHFLTALNKSERQRELQDSFKDNTRLRAKLTESERKRIVDMQLIITPDMLKFWEAQIFDAFLKTVENDPKLIERFIYELALIPGFGLNRTARIPQSDEIIS